MNAANCTVLELLNSTGAPLHELDFVVQFEGKRFTNKGDEKTVMDMYKKLYENEPGRNAREAAFGMATLVFIFVVQIHAMIDLVYG
mmetsp:Transcript_7980/g.24599  ORF Transcript_7980/g.24599 Transcript_7980/m.24599 type:complete len:86 (+) Transcript_7980:145-402(+)